MRLISNSIFPLEVRRVTDELQAVDLEHGGVVTSEIENRAARRLQHSAVKGEKDTPRKRENYLIVSLRPDAPNDGR